MGLLILVAAFLLAASRGIAISKCLHHGFFLWPGINREGVVKQAISGDICATECERMCLLYTDCTGFNFNVNNGALESGFCEILTSKHNWTHTNLSDVEWAFYEKGYNAQNVALPSRGTTCNASAEANENRKCDNVMDGLVTVPWVTKVLDNSQWVELNFNDSYEIRRVDIYHRCRYGTQCVLIDLSFNYGQVIHVSRECNYYPDANCSSLPVEMYYVDMIQSSLVRISCTQRCIMNENRIGFDEILVWV